MSAFCQLRRELRQWSLLSEWRSDCRLCFSKEKMLCEEETPKSHRTEEESKESSSSSSEEDEGEDEASESEAEKEAGDPEAVGPKSAGGRRVSEGRWRRPWGGPIPKQGPEIVFFSLLIMRSPCSCRLGTEEGTESIVLRVLSLLCGESGVLSTVGPPGSRLAQGLHLRAGGRRAPG